MSQDDKDLVINRDLVTDRCRQRLSVVKSQPLLHKPAQPQKAASFNQK
jgi:hypothetical protein